MTQAVIQNNIEVVDEQIANILRSKSVAERIAMIADANDTARLLAAAGARHLHPDWSDSQIAAEVARRMLRATD